MLILNPWWNNKNVSKGAFGTDLACPFCRTVNKFKDLGWVNPLRKRLQCKICNKTFQYDISNNEEVIRKELARTR